MSVPTFSIKIITLVYSSDPKHIPHLFPIPFQREGMELSGCTDNYSRNGNISYIHGLEASDGTERSSSGWSTLRVRDLETCVRARSTTGDKSSWRERL